MPSAVGREPSPREAALLAAILPNPVRRSARNPGPGVRRLAGTYMARAQAGAVALLARKSRFLSQFSDDFYRAGLALRHSILYKPGLIGISPRFAALSRPLRADASDNTREDCYGRSEKKTSPSRRGMRRSADALKKPTYAEDKDSGELRRPHHLDLKTGMYKGRQV